MVSLGALHLLFGSFHLDLRCFSSSFGEKVATPSDSPGMSTVTVGDRLQKPMKLMVFVWFCMVFVMVLE